jgi:hypothetical protein
VDFVIRRKMGQVPESSAEIENAQGGGVPRANGDAKPRKLRDLVREAIRSRHYSRRTEKTYWHCIKSFIYFCGKRHPLEVGAGEVSDYLSWLATEREAPGAIAHVLT